MLPPGASPAHSCSLTPPILPSHPFTILPCIQHMPSRPHQKQGPSLPHTLKHDWPTFCLIGIGSVEISAKKDLICYYSESDKSEGVFIDEYSVV